MQPRRLRAPASPGGLLIEPALGAFPAFLADNHRRIQHSDFRLLDRPFSELRRQARLDLLHAAREYLRGASEPIPITPSVPQTLLLAGHQPELFHPGVWVKNFVLNGLAQNHEAVPINLVIDNDAPRSASLRMPAWEDPVHCDPAGVRGLLVPFDASSGETPYEERRVLDETLFASLPERVAERTAGWNFEPLLPAFWQSVLRQRPRTDRLGERLAAARRALERRWGCHNLEVPLSHVCRSESFIWFALHILTELPRFHAIYNACVREYRQLYGIRSRFHPVPELTAEGDWLEAPFWAWRTHDVKRGRLLARIGATGIDLRVGAETWANLPRDPLAAMAAWQTAEIAGAKVRSRALTTTLFARLFLADAFMHGIGGAKYDELTDEIARRFYAVELPAYLVVSATLHLPLPAYPALPEDARRLAGLSRDLRWNPQRHLEEASQPSARLRELAEEKQRWIGLQPSNHRERRERCLMLRQLTEELATLLTGRIAAVRQDWQRRLHETRANAILQQRDYAFCLFPEDSLRDYCQRLLKQS